MYKYGNELNLESIFEDFKNNMSDYYNSNLEYPTINANSFYMEADFEGEYGSPNLFIYTDSYEGINFEYSLSPNYTFNINEIFVPVNLRKKGVGSKLVEVCERTAKKHSLDIILHNVLSEAEEFWIKKGYDLYDTHGLKSHTLIELPDYV